MSSHQCPYSHNPRNTQTRPSQNHISTAREHMHTLHTIANNAYYREHGAQFPRCAQVYNAYKHTLRTRYTMVTPVHHAHPCTHAHNAYNANKCTHTSAMHTCRHMWTMLTTVHRCVHAAHNACNVRDGTHCSPCIPMQTGASICVKRLLPLVDFHCLNTPETAENSHFRGDV